MWVSLEVCSLRFYNPKTNRDVVPVLSLYTLYIPHLLVLGVVRVETQKPCSVQDLQLRAIRFVEKILHHPNAQNYIKRPRPRIPSSTIEPQGTNTV